MSSRRRARQSVAEPELDTAPAPPVQPRGSQSGGVMGFLKSISLRTWIIGGFVVLFLIWFLPRLKTFAKIAGILGMAAALAYLLPFATEAIAAAFGFLGVALAGAIAVAKKFFGGDKSEAETKTEADDTYNAIEENFSKQQFESEAIKEEANEAGTRVAVEMQDEYVSADDLDDWPSEVDETVNDTVDGVNDTAKLEAGAAMMKARLRQYARSGQLPCQRYN